MPLDMRQQELELAHASLQPQLEHAKKVLADPDPDRKDEFPHERNYAQRAVRMQESPDKVSIILQAVRIGELGISAIPFEVFTETGLELKASNPFSRVSRWNGQRQQGYLPTPEQHRLGATRLGWAPTGEVQATVKIVDVLQKMFAELAETP
ncbi:MAG: hypothetical protein R3C56_03345 [Pirellulaceae bacterium]